MQDSTQDHSSPSNGGLVTLTAHAVMLAFEPGANRASFRARLDRYAVVLRGESNQAETRRAEGRR